MACFHQSLWAEERPRRLQQRRHAKRCRFTPGLPYLPIGLQSSAQLSLQAESVSRHLGVPVLLHAVKKPGCHKLVVDYFTSEPQSGLKGKGKGQSGVRYPSVPIVDVCVSDQRKTSLTISRMRHHTGILVIGDRVMTDVVLANRMNGLHRNGNREGALQAVSVLTTTVWEMEGLGSRIMRTLETIALRRVSHFYKKRRNLNPLQEWSHCVAKQEMPVHDQRPARTQRRSFRERVMAFLNTLTEPLRNAVATGRSRTRARLESFLQEAREAQYGFRFPDGLLRARRLREIVEGNVKSGSNIGYRK